jgi:hypothetical protein
MDVGKTCMNEPVFTGTMKNVSTWQTPPQGISETQRQGIFLGLPTACRRGAPSGAAESSRRLKRGYRFRIPIFFIVNAGFF